MAYEQTRARKVGDQFEIERKLEKRYDDQEQIGNVKAVVEWINKVLSGEIEACPGMDWESICKWLKDGVVLCKLVSKLLVADGKAKVSFSAKAKTAFAAMANVENFNKGCIEYGIKQASTFQTVDLTDGRKGPFVNVIDCLGSLGFQANKKGFSPAFEPPAAPQPDW